LPCLSHNLHGEHSLSRNVPVRILYPSSPSGLNFIARFSQKAYANSSYYSRDYTTTLLPRGMKVVLPLIVVIVESRVPVPFMAWLCPLFFFSCIVRDPAIGCLFLPRSPIKCLEIFQCTEINCALKLLRNAEWKRLFRTEIIGLKKVCILV
jgi:hypothetical protein